jgi:hypothetical protein
MGVSLGTECECIGQWVPRTSNIDIDIDELMSFFDCSEEASWFALLLFWLISERSSTAVNESARKIYCHGTT